MTRPIDLCININNKILIIPFNSLEEVDIFTSRYKDRYSFLNSLIKILEIDVKIKDITSVYIETSKKKNLPIKYAKDNYNIDSLTENFTLYLIKNKSTITDGMKKILTNISGNDNIENLSLKDMNFIVRRYLDSRYSVQRNIYFMIKDDMDIKIDKINNTNTNIKRNELSKIDSTDPYIQYLIGLSQRGYDELAIEELSKIDLDELKNNLNGDGYSIFDGINNNDLSIYEDMIVLEESTGMSIDEIKDICIKQINNRHRK